MEDTAEKKGRREREGWGPGVLGSSSPASGHSGRHWNRRRRSWGESKPNIFRIGLKSLEAVDFVSAMSRKVQRSEVCADCSAPGKAEIYGSRRCCEPWLSSTRSYAAASGWTPSPRMRRDTRFNASGKCPKIKADTAAQQSSYLKPTLNLELNQYVGYNTTEQ